LAWIENKPKNVVFELISYFFVFSTASKIIRHVVTIEMQCSKIKTALPACFDEILVTHHRHTAKKVTFTSDLPLIPLNLT
jgi:hypothetical protein